MPRRDRVDDLSEICKALKNNGDVFAKSFKRVPIHSIFQIIQESRCSQKWLHGEFSLKARIRRKRKGEPDSSYFVVSIGKKLRFGIPDAINNPSIIRTPDSTINISQGIKVLADDSVLVGVRESVNSKKGVSFRVWLAMERLYVPNIGQAASYSAEAPAGQSALIGSDLPAVFRLTLKNGKLMAVSDLDFAGHGKLGNNVVKGAPEVMYDIPRDKPEEVLLRWNRDRENGGPAIWVDFAYVDGVRVAIFDESMELSLEGFVMDGRLCDLCNGTAEVKV